MQQLRTSFVDSLAIPLHALKLLVRHWPAIIVVLCTAFAFRAGVLWLAVTVSDFSPFLATLIVPLAPLALMAGLIVALWLMQPSLPFLATAMRTPGSGYLTTNRLLTIGGLLIPFLTVYASNGLLKDDIRTFIYDATFDEAMNNFINADFSRVFISHTAAALALIAVVLVIRKFIGYFALGERGFGFATFSAYLETLWMVSLSATLTANFSDLEEWLSTRAVIAPAYQNFLEAKAALIESSGLLGKLYVGAGAVLAKLDDIVVVPLAWLTLGAVLFGTTLVPKAAVKQATGGKHRKQGKLSKSAAFAATSSQAKLLIESAASPIWGPIKVSWDGLRKLALAGVVPMIVFCLIFILCSATEILTVLAGRAIVGPQDMLLSAVAEPYVLTTARIGYFLVALPLLAAALDRFLRHSYAQDATEAAEELLSPAS